MCNVSEGIREEALKEGQEIGEKIGEKRGEKRATLETRIEDALNLMTTLKMSAEEVLTAMRVPAKSRAELLKSINERLAAE